MRVTTRITVPVLCLITVLMTAPLWAAEEEYPFQQGSSPNAAGINYDSLKAAEAMKRLKELESLRPPNK
jgi:hypothetical protein